VSEVGTGWVAEPVAWRDVVPGDTVELDDGTLGHVTGTGPDGDHWRIDVAQQYWTRSLHEPAPGTVVPVLKRRDVLIGEVIERTGP